MEAEKRHTSDSANSSNNDEFEDIDDSAIFQDWEELIMARMASSQTGKELKSVSKLNWFPRFIVSLVNSFITILPVFYLNTGISIFPHY